MPLMVVSECACPKSPPREKAALVRRKAPLSLILAPRAAFGVHPGSATYEPLSETSTSLPRSMASDSMPFGRVAAAVTPCRSQAPDKESKAFAPR